MASFSSNGITVEFNMTEDNKDEILGALTQAVNRGLSACGEVAVGYAQELCPVDTGNLRGSITYGIDGDSCYIGTNVSYAPYVEFGTGQNSEVGGSPSIVGQRPQPFLRPSASDHADEYSSILEDSLKNA